MTTIQEIEELQRAQLKALKKVLNKLLTNGSRNRK